MKIVKSGFRVTINFHRRACDGTDPSVMQSKVRFNVMELKYDEVKIVCGLLGTQEKKIEYFFPSWTLLDTLNLRSTANR